MRKVSQTDPYKPLDDFIAANLRPPNAWVSFPALHLTAYMRKSERYFGGSRVRVKSIDIGNVTVDEEYQGRGIFTQFCDEVAKRANALGWAVYHESVQNERLIPFHLGRGYTQEGDVWPPSFYKVPE